MENEIRREDIGKVVKDYCDSFGDCCTGCKLLTLCHVGCLFCNDSLNDSNAPYFKQAYDIITSTENDLVNHPTHYCDGGIETIDFIKAKLTENEFVGFCKGNAVKYISRAGKKNPDKLKEDLAKAVFYLNAVITND